MLKQVEPLVDSPERLLQALEMEIILSRTKRQSSQGRRLAVLAGGFLLIAGGTAVALGALFSTVTEMPRPHHTADAPEQAIMQPQ